MENPKTQPVYIVLHDRDDKWSVVDKRTGLALVVDGIPMVLLSHQQATEIVAAVNARSDVPRIQ